LRARRLINFILVACLSSIAFADNVVDVSKEWNERAGNAPAPEKAGSATAAAKAVEESSTTYAACGCETLTPQERLEDSTYAFTGRVSELSKVKNGKRTVVFDIDEVFKGSPKLDMKVTEEMLGTECDLPFKEGESFLVFTRWEWGSVKTSRCMGTKLLKKAQTAALGPSEELKEKLYLRLRNACMGRGDTPCCLSSIKAMRVGYYVPEPPQGCADGSVPDRLRCGGSYTWCIPVTEKGHH
jgi:hypothetical protein